MEDGSGGKVRSRERREGAGGGGIVSHFTGDLNGEPEVFLTPPARGTWATRGISQPRRGRLELFVSWRRMED